MINETTDVVREPFGRSAVLVGGPGGTPGFAAAGYRSILWCVDSLGAMLPLPGADQTVVHTLVLDGREADEILSALDRFGRRDPFGVPELFVSRAFAATGHAHAAVVAEIRAWIEERHLDQPLQQRLGFLRQKHFLLNVTEYVRRRVPVAWRGALRGWPALVCGAGPSLDVSVAALAPVADHSIVFAVDSALRALGRYGVAVDFAVALSSRKTPARCLVPGAEPTRVVLSTVSPVSWREVIPPDRCYFLARAHPTEAWLADQGVAVAPVAADANCGLTALELARFLGCAPIHLFGIDLAVDAANPAAHHSADADVGTDPRDLPDLTALSRVPGNYAQDVPTFLCSAWRALDARLASWPPGLVHNVNDRGARLARTRLVHPSQFRLAPHSRANKRAALAHLEAPTLVDPEAARVALAALGAQGTLGCRKLDGLRAAQARGGAAALAREMRCLLADPDLARALGSFTQRLRPHLDAKAVVDAEFWSEALDEFEELCCLAEAVYGASIA